MTDWEQRYRDKDTPWEKGAAAPPLRAWLNLNPIRGRVLVPGCGIGDDVRLLASHGATVIGLDIASSAIRRARSCPVVGKENYRLGDILDLPKSLEGQFDWVFEHTCYCAIDPSDRPAYVDGVTRALLPGGRMLGLFYPFTGNPPGEGPPFPASLEELDDAFRKSFTLLTRWIPAVGYPGRVGNEDFRILQKKSFEGIPIP